MGKDLKPQLCSCHKWSNTFMQESVTLCQYCVTFRSYCQLHVKRVPENGQQKLTLLTAELWIFWHERKFFFCMFWHLLFMLTLLQKTCKIWAALIYHLTLNWTHISSCIPRENTAFVQSLPIFSTEWGIGIFALVFGYPSCLLW